LHALPFSKKDDGLLEDEVQRDGQRPGYERRWKSWSWLRDLSAQLQRQKNRELNTVTLADKERTGYRLAKRRSVGSRAYILVLDVTKVAYILFDRSDVFFKSVRQVF
jgi:hypothetical protein